MDHAFTSWAQWTGPDGREFSIRLDVSKIHFEAASIGISSGHIPAFDGSAVIQFTVQQPAGITPRGEGKG